MDLLWIDGSKQRVDRADCYFSPGSVGTRPLPAAGLSWSASLVLASNPLSPLNIFSSSPAVPTPSEIRAHPVYHPPVHTNQGASYATSSIPFHLSTRLTRSPVLLCEACLLHANTCTAHSPPLTILPSRQLPSPGQTCSSRHPMDPHVRIQMNINSK